MIQTRPLQVIIAFVSLAVSPADAFVAARGRIVFSCRRSSPSMRTFVSTAGANMDTDAYLFGLMDEAVMLWSRTVNQNGSAKDDNGIMEFRERELVELVEDVAKTIMHYEDPPEQTAPTDGLFEEVAQFRPFEGLTLLQITQQLDKAILRGYSSSFSEKEFDGWVDGIESLSVELQRRLDSGETLKDARAEQMKMASVEPPVPVNPVQALVERFERLELLLGSARKPEPIPASSFSMTDVVEPEFSISAGSKDAEVPKLSLPTEVVTEKLTRQVSKLNQGERDFIMAAVSTAALGATVATEIPYYAFGIALGPVIQAAINYARRQIKGKKSSSKKMS